MRCSAAAQLNLSARSEAAVTPVAVCTAVFTNLRRSIIMASSSSWLYGENYTRGVGGRKNAGQCLKVIHHGGHGGTQGKTGSRPNFLRLRRFSSSSFFLLLGYLKIVVDGKNAGDAVGADAGQIFVGCTVDNTLECDVAVLDDDADGLLHAQRISLQSGVAIDGAEQTLAQAVVHGRGRKHFDLIVDVVDAFDVLDRVLGVGFCDRASDLSEKSDIEAVHFVRNVIEDGEVGQHEQFVANFLDDPFGGAGSGLVALILRDGCGGKR